MIDGHKSKLSAAVSSPPPQPPGHTQLLVETDNCLDELAGLWSLRKIQYLKKELNTSKMRARTGLAEPHKTKYLLSELIVFIIQIITLTSRALKLFFPYCTLRRKHFDWKLLLFSVIFVVLYNIVLLRVIIIVIKIPATEI